MESETKKRKIEEIEEQEKHEEAAEEGEEEKMEKFFALIRRTRDIMHDYVHTRRCKEREGKNIGQVKVARAVWNPSFQPQDFMEPEFPYNKDVTQAATAAATPSGSKKEEEEEQQDYKTIEEQEEEGRGKDLDLKLSL